MASFTEEVLLKFKVEGNSLTQSSQKIAYSVQEKVSKALANMGASAKTTSAVSGDVGAVAGGVGMMALGIMAIVAILADIFPPFKIFLNLFKVIAMLLLLPLIPILIPFIKLLVATIPIIRNIMTAIQGWVQKAVDFIEALPGNIWNFFVQLWEDIKQIAPAIGAWLLGLPGAIWNLLVQGFNWVKGIISNVWNTLINLWGAIQGIGSNVWNFIKGGFESLVKWLTTIWNDIVALPGKIWDFIKSIPGMIADAIRGFLNFGSNIISGVKGFFGIHDGIITKDGKVIKTDPNDTIYASKNGAPSGGNVTINITNPRFNNKQDIDMLVNEISRRLQSRVRGRTANVGGV